MGTIKLTTEEYKDLIYALIRAIEVLEAEKNPRLEAIRKIFKEI